MQQLLTIRVPTLNFATDSGKYAARMSFLQTVDKHLFFKLASERIRGDAKIPGMQRPLHALGFRIALILGAEQLLEQERAAAADEELPPLSSIWAVKLDTEEWPDT